MPLRRSRPALALVLCATAAGVSSGPVRAATPAGGAPTATSLPFHGGAHIYRIPALVRRLLPIARRAGLPVLLPASLPLGPAHVHVSGGHFSNSYAIALESTPSCGSKTSCSVAAFTGAVNHGTPLSGEPVALAHGIAGGFLPAQCGGPGACSPPDIRWIIHDVYYVIEAWLPASSNPRSTLIAAADSAIEAGRR